MKLLISRSLGLSILALFHFSANAKKVEPISFEQVIGQSFISSAGSSGGSFLMSVSVKIQTQNIVRVGFVENGIDWGSADVAAIEESSNSTDIEYIVINCKNKSYSTKPKEDDAYAHKAFTSGSMYQWGTFPTRAMLSNLAPKTEASLTKYFQNVCAYINQ